MDELTESLLCSAEGFTLKKEGAEEEFSYSSQVNLSHLTFSKILPNLRFTKKNILTFKGISFILFFLQPGKNVQAPSVQVELKYNEAKDFFF